MVSGNSVRTGNGQKDHYQKLSEDLKEYEGFSRSNLFYMLKLFDSFTEEEIVQQPVGQIPWGHIINIMSKCESKESRLWYINKTYENSWSRSVLIKQIKAKAYERNTIEPIVSKGIKDYSNHLIKEILKDSYVLEIMDKEFNNEKELKDKIEGMGYFV